MSTVARLTIDQYDRMIAAGILREDQRVELIHGEIRDMSPIGPDHETAVDKFTEWSFESLPKKKVWVRVQNSVGVPELDSAPQPDIVWVARRDYRSGRPTADDVLLIVEVAESSLRFDRSEKAELYATAGVKDYWLLNLVDHSIEVRRTPNRGTYRELKVYSGRDKVSPLAFPKIALPVKLIFG